MKAFIALCRVYLESSFGLSGFLSSLKGNRKKALKSVGMGLLVALCLGDVGFIFGMLDLASYDALKPMGLQWFVVMNAITTASLLTFVMGFLTAVSTYYIPSIEPNLLAMPLKPRALFGAKFTMVYATECLVSLFLIGICLVIFGVKEAPPLPFYLYGAAIAILTPVLPLALAYLLIVPLFSFARFLRNKNAMVFLGGVLGVAFAVAYSLVFQSATARMGDPAWIAANFAGPDSLLAKAGAAYPPAIMGYRALAGSTGWEGLLYFLALSAIAAAALGLAVLLCSKAYASSLGGFGETRAKKLAKGRIQAFMASSFARRPAFAALVHREFVSMNREPVFFLNGPLVIVLLPVIMAISLVAQGDELAKTFGALTQLREGAIGMLLAAAAGGFMGTSSSVASTALSREGKSFSWLKSLPMRGSTYFLAKLAHAGIFSAFGVIVGSGGVAALMGLDAPRALGSVFIALAFSALMDILDLWLDAARPKLDWTNPIAGMKQNLNSVLAILATMGIIAILGVTCAFANWGYAAYIAVYGGGMALAAAGLIAAFIPWADRRFANLEA